MPDKTLKIELQANGTLSVTMDKFKVQPNDNLIIECGIGEFAVLFDNDRNPSTGTRKVHGANRGEVVKFRIRNLTQSEKREPEDDRVKGATFKYGVAVMQPGTGHVLTMDPDIIIDDPGGGG